MGNFFIRSVMVKGSTQPSITEEIVRRVLRKAKLKWNHFQMKGILGKNDLKLTLAARKFLS